MSLAEDVVVDCPHCGRERTTRLWSSVNVTVDPDLRDALFAQKLNVLECECGCKVQLDSDLLYHDMDRRFQVWLKYPDADGSITVEGPAVEIAKALPGYRLRIVQSFPELAEKIMVFEAELDDRCVEILKSLVERHFGAEPRDRMDLFFAGVTDDGPEGRTLVFVDRAIGDANNPITVKQEAYDDIAVRLDPDSDRSQWRFVEEAYGSKAAKHFLAPAPKPEFQVLVDDNFHHMDEDARYLAGDFETWEAAVEECRRIVDVSLESLYEPGMDGDKLFKLYTGFGEDPFVRGPADGGGFSAWDYARERSAEICAEKEGRLPASAEVQPQGARVHAAPLPGPVTLTGALRFLGLVAGCWGASVVVVMFGYLQWEDLAISFAVAARYAAAWPLVVGFGAMSIYAVALPIVIRFFSRGGSDLTEKVIGTHIILGWLLLLWSYPGTEQVGRYSDPWANIVMGIVWTVQLATALVTLRVFNPSAARNAG